MEGQMDARAVGICANVISGMSDIRPVRREVRTSEDDRQ